MTKEYVDAIAYGRESLGRNLRLAREIAGLTIEELAEQMGREAWMVSAVEEGKMACGDVFVLLLLRTCGLPDDWKPS